MAASRRENLGPDLSAYLDGELSEQRARETERLLAESPEARRELEDLRKVANQVAALPRLRAPGKLGAVLCRSAEETKLSMRTRRPAAGRVLQLFVRLSAAAAVLVTGVLIGREWGQRSRPGPTGAAGAEHVAAFKRAEPNPTLAGRGALQEGAAPSVTAGKPAELADAAKTSPAGAPVSDAFARGVGDELGERVTTEPAVAGDSSAGAQFAVKFDRDADATAGVGGAPPADGSYKGASPPLAVSDQPSVEVWVAPQTVEQYAAAAAILAQCDKKDRDSGFGVAAGEPAPAGSEERIQLGVEFQRQIAARDVAPLVESLEQRAPQQVYVQVRCRWTDLSRPEKLGSSAIASNGAGVPDRVALGAAAAETDTETERAVVERATESPASAPEPVTGQPSDKQKERVEIKKPKAGADAAARGPRGAPAGAHEAAAARSARGGTPEAKPKSDKSAEARRSGAEAEHSEKKVAAGGRGSVPAPSRSGRADRAAPATATDQVARPASQPPEPTEERPSPSPPERPEPPPAAAPDSAGLYSTVEPPTGVEGAAESPRVRAAELLRRILAALERAPTSSTAPSSVPAVPNPPPPPITVRVTLLPPPPIPAAIPATQPASAPATEP